MIKLTDLISEKVNVPNAGDIWGFIKSGYIPLSPTMMKRLEISKPVKAVHGTNEIGLSWLKNIESSKKSISTATKWNNDFLTKGVGTGIFTCFACLKGNSIAHFPGDVFSVTDTTGRRWVGLHMAKADTATTKSKRAKIDKTIDKMHMEIVQKVAKKYKLDTIYQPDWRKEAAVQSFFNAVHLGTFLNDVADSEIKKIKSEIIKLYMDGIEKKVGKDLEWVINNSGAVGYGGFGTGGYGWDEIVLNQVKIEKVYTTRDFVKHSFDNDQDRADKYPQLKKSKFDMEFVRDIKELDGKLKKWVGK